MARMVPPGAESTSPVRDAATGTPPARLHSGMTLALLRLGAGANVRNARGETALMIAAEFGHSGQLKALLAAGADTSLRANDGRSAYDIAKARGPNVELDSLKPGSPRARPGS